MTRWTLFACGIACAFAAQAQAQSTGAPPSTATIAYPSRGQTAKQQDKDKYECHEWAKGQSGFDPVRAAEPSTAATAPATSTATAGAMTKGALGGAAVAELAHRDAGRGAAAGVLGGAMLEQTKARQQAQMKQQQAAQQQAAARNQRAAYDRAVGACLDARGYTVR